MKTIGNGFLKKSDLWLVSFGAASLFLYQVAAVLTHLFALRAINTQNMSG